MGNAEIDGILRLLYNMHKGNPKKMREDLLKIYPFFADGESKTVQNIRKDWIENSSKDRVAAAICKEKEFASLEIIPNPKNVWCWGKTRSSPPFLLPENETNADIINVILKKSMEIQASSCPELLVDDYILDRNAFKVHGFVMYYFSRIPGNQNHSQKEVFKLFKFHTYSYSILIRFKGTCQIS